MYEAYSESKYRAFKMFKMIERPAGCETRSVLNARNMKPADIRRQTYKVYGKN
jgi:hypothetical protein